MEFRQSRGKAAPQSALGKRLLSSLTLERCAAIAIAVSALSTFESCTSRPAGDRAASIDTARAAEPAPEVFRVRFETSRGPFVVEAHRAWAPLGVDRFHYLVQNGFYDDTRFFRVLSGYIAQFGISGNPQTAAMWKERFIRDDTLPHQANSRGRVSFASAGPQTRTTQLFIDLRDNPTLDQSYPPIGQIVEGMNVVDSLWTGYGEGAPNGRGPDQSRLFAEGNRYLALEFPKLDYVKTARIVK